MVRKILFLCTGNSARSQMAEAIVNTRLPALPRWPGSEDWEAFSAGTRPAGYVHPDALRTLAEIGLVHEGRSKHVGEFRDVPFDLVITVCDDAAKNCPVWLGKGHRVHLGIPDPALATGTGTGTQDETAAVFRTTRDDIARKVPELLRRWAIEDM